MASKTILKVNHYFNEWMEGRWTLIVNNGNWLSWYFKQFQQLQCVFVCGCVSLKSVSNEMAKASKLDKHQRQDWETELPLNSDHWAKKGATFWGHFLWTIICNSKPTDTMRTVEPKRVVTFAIRSQQTLSEQMTTLTIIQWSTVLPGMQNGSRFTINLGKI